MNQEVIKRGRGRPKILTDEQRKNNKSNYMLNKEWYCEFCNTGRNYKLAGKFSHLKTQKQKECRKAYHEKNYEHNI